MSKKYEKTKIMMRQILEQEGYTFNNTTKEALEVYTPSKEDYFTVWNTYDLNQNCNKYKWTNLPKGLTSWNLERMLYYYGALCGFEYNGLVYILPFTPTKDLNAYGFPTTVQPITFNGRTPDASSKAFFGTNFKLETVIAGDKDAKNKAILLMDSIPEACGTFIPKSRFALNQILIRDIVETLKRININIVVSNKKIVIECQDSKQAEIIRQELAKGYSTDSPFIVTTNPTRSTNLSQGGEFIAQDLFNAVRQYDSIRCQHSGVLTKSFGQDKKERVNSGELMGEKEQVQIIYDGGLQLRKDFANEMNKYLSKHLDGPIGVVENVEAKEETASLVKEVKKNE